MSILLRDARFWVALLLLVRAVLFYVAPEFPMAVWAAVDAFVGVVLAVLAGNNVVQVQRADAVERSTAVAHAVETVSTTAAVAGKWSGSGK